MKPITKAQRLAIKRIYDRLPIYSVDKSSAQIAMEAGWRYVSTATLSETIRETSKYPYVWVSDRHTPIYADSDDIVADYHLARRISYREFRKTVQSGWDCLMVKWQGMTLGIEHDGYTHS